MKYAQAIEDGYEFPLSIEIEGVGTLAPGRLFQISQPQIQKNPDGSYHDETGVWLPDIHVREMGWYRCNLIMQNRPGIIGKDFGYWGTQGTYLIQSRGPFNKNGTEKDRCRTIPFNVGEGASGSVETRIWKIAKGREAANSQGIKLVKPAENGRAEKYADFEEWARQHEGEQFSTSDLAEKSGFSSQTVLKYLKTSAHFIKIKQGLYECGQNQPV